jgi:hypothetical protein
MILIGLLLAWSLALGLGLAQAMTPPATIDASVSAAATESSPVGTVDVVPQRYQLGQQLYLENCATCHIGIPPAVLPTETWRDLLRDPQHYGAELQPLVDPSRRLVWNYLQFASRQVLADEKVPYRIADSKYFKVLHPKVKFPQKAALSSCVTCHTGAEQFNFRSLTPQWENSP